MDIRPECVCRGCIPLPPSSRQARDADGIVPGPRRRRFLELLRRGFALLKARRDAHGCLANLAGLGVDGLKDIGLSRSDLSSVRKGLFFDDDTRRKR